MTTKVVLWSIQLGQLASQIPQIMDWFNRTVQENATAISAFGAAMLHFAYWARYSTLVKSAGWLPHCEMPYQELDKHACDPNAITELILTHYRDNWQEIRANLESVLERCPINEESKLTFREALEAHQSGLYRSVCRVLLPEIERLVRVELKSDKVGTIRVEQVFKCLADRGEISYEQLQLGDIYNHDLLGQLMHHLYKEVREENRQEFIDDPVPNRHAAIHGLVTYSTEQNSLNTIFMADYVFCLVPVLNGASEMATHEN